MSDDKALRLADLLMRLRTLADMRRLEGDNDEADVVEEAISALAQQAEPVQAEPVVDRSEATLLAVWHEAMAREPKRNEAKREKHHRTAFELRRLHSENELLRTQQQAEPVVWECKAGGLKPLSQRLHDLQPDNIKRHYTPTPRRHEWQGLTEDDFPAIRDGDTAFRSGALWADRLLKEKNYG